MTAGVRPLGAGEGSARAEPEAALYARLHARLHDAVAELHAAACADRPADPRAAEQMRDLCAQARHLNVPPARLLVILKEAWRGLRTRGDVLGWQRSEAGLDRVVTFCIAAYYLVPAAASAPAAPAGRDGPGA